MDLNTWNLIIIQRRIQKYLLSQRQLQCRQSRHRQRRDYHQDQNPPRDRNQSTPQEPVSDKSKLSHRQLYQSHCSPSTS